jgi:myo-inositol-1(or 4)-monophosphatase
VREIDAERISDNASARGCANRALTQPGAATGRSKAGEAADVTTSIPPMPERASEPRPGPAVDWLALCRRIVEGQRHLFAEVPGIVARSVYEGVGEGGDRALAIDRRAEDLVFAELEGLRDAGTPTVAISEERGEVPLGDGDGPRVVIDPIDGSLNARRTIPWHALSIAVASGPTMADVEFGYVYDFGGGEEFIAERGRGASLDGRELRPERAFETLEVVGVESAKPAWLLPVIEGLAERAYRVRSVGAIAITLAWVAAGRLDGMLTARDCRSVDAAAAQLIAVEAGAEVAFGELSRAEAPLSLDARYKLAGALDAEGLRVLSEIQRSL